MSKDKIIPPQKDVQVAIEWRIPEGVPSPFATNMLVQIIENEFKLLFFEVKPPLRLNDSDPHPSSVAADCVGTVVITADRFPKFIEAMQQQLDKYKTRKGIK